jgi:GAF domain
MDSYSIFNQATPSSVSDLGGVTQGLDQRDLESEVTQMSAGQSVQGRISALLATADRVPGATVLSPPARFSRENAGHSIAEVAQRDLDAALQLLAERAQYITGASGAAIALRRDGLNDMLCRASAGSNAPELGALLSAEFGLSGESVRTRLPLRCDDAERDSRVNREGCRQLGIASVAVMPIVSDDEVLGVFELFSGKVNAFEERDISTLQRLSEMVETAVRLARTAQTTAPEFMAEFVTDVRDVPEIMAEAKPDAPPPLQTPGVLRIEAVPDHTPKPVAAEPAVAAVRIKKPLFWSAASQPAANPAAVDQSHLPPVLRNLRKCRACGFPVSEGRTLCVECEEKQWRGQLRAAPRIAPQKSAAAAATASAVIATSGAVTPKPASQPAINAGRAETAPGTVQTAAPSPPSRNLGQESVTPSTRLEVAGASATALPFLSAGGSPSESWLSANRYVLVGVLVIAIVLAVIVVLR